MDLLSLTEEHKYWFVNLDDMAVDWAQGFGGVLSATRKQNGNYFETKEEAEQFLTHIKSWFKR